MNKVIVLALIGMLLLAACNAQTATEGDPEIEEAAGDRQTEQALAEVTPTSETIDTETTLDEAEPSDSEGDDALSASADDVEPSDSEDEDALDAVVEDDFAKGAPLPEDVLIVVDRSGGIAGVDERWVIFSNGRVEGPDGFVRTVDPNELGALMKLVETSGFSEMAESYVTLDTCCDRFTYGITVNMGDGKSKTVVTIDASSKQPEELTELLTSIGQVLFVESFTE